MMRRLLILLSCLALLAPAAHSQSDLPSFGEGNSVSLQQEYYLGRAWLMSFRRQAPIYDDPLMQEYIESLVYRLVETSQLQERRLIIVLVKNQSINAFAVPGGIVGVHTGLIQKAEAEAQLASVLTHELAHLSQRHFARGIENQKKSNAAMMGGLLAGLVAIAAGAPDAGMGAIMGGQAAAMDSQLSYSRAHEQEADRVGIQNLAASGMDPGGAAAMFTVMQKESRRYGSRPPEFLMTHPLTEKRIADARNRAGGYPKRIYPDNTEFQLMRARVELSFIDDPKKAVQHFETKRKKGGRYAVASQYGWVLALTRNGQFDEARKLLKPMRSYAPHNLIYSLAEANIEIESGSYDKAITRLQYGLQLSPGSHPITMYLAEAYFRAGYFGDAEKLLKAHSRVKRLDPQLWYMLAEVQGKTGNILGLHQSRAEYFYLNGAMNQAIQQLELALPKAKDNVTYERVQNRIVYFKNVARALGQL
ncbi:MAG: M48 family metalloprotease [Haliea sp.]|nr:M48 family metalloprotease [Haliea sp.]